MIIGGVIAIIGTVATHRREPRRHLIGGIIAAICLGLIVSLPAQTIMDVPSSPHQTLPCHPPQGCWAVAGFEILASMKAAGAIDDTSWRSVFSPLYAWLVHTPC